MAGEAEWDGQERRGARRATEAPQAVLIVDDMPANLGMLAHALEEQGLQVAIAQEGEEGLSRARWLRPDLILLDVMMPGMGGLEICRRLKAQAETRDIPVIFMTAFDSSGCLAGFAAGGVDYVTKPLRIEEVVARAQVHLQLRATQRRLQAQNAELRRRKAGLRREVTTCSLELRDEVAGRRHVEARLREQELNYHEMFHNAADGMFLLEVTHDRRFRYLETNRAFESMVRVAEDTMPGRYVEETAQCYGGEDMARLFLDMLERCVATGAAMAEELEGQLPFARLALQATLIPIREAGRVARILCVMRDVTERKKAEVRLWASEQSLRAILDNSPDTIVRYDRDCRRTYVSPHYLLSHGVSAEAVLGKRTSEVWRSTDLSAGQFDRKLCAVMDTGIPADIEFNWIGADGEERFHWMRAVPESDPAGNAVGVLGIVRDVSAMKRAERALSAREREFRTLIEHAPDNISRFDTDARLRYANPALLKTLGQPLEALLGKRSVDVFPGKPVLQQYLALLQQVIATGQPAEFLMVDPEGGARPFYDAIRMAPEFSADGKVVGVIAIGRDLSRQRELEMEVVAHERQFHALLENLPDSIVRYDRQLRRTYFNQAYLEWAGVAEAEAFGTTPLELWRLAEPDAQGYVALLERVLATGEPEEIQAELADSKQPPRYFAMYLVPERGDAGEVASVLSISRDITALKTTEQGLEESRARLRTLTAKRESAREEERKRVAREMHDELGQRLTSLRMDIAGLRMQFARSQGELSGRLQEMVAAVDGTLQVVRSVATRLRPAALDMGIVSALEWLAADFSKRCGVVCDLRLPLHEIELDDHQATALFRIVQESFTNIVRHARARRAWVAFDRAESGYMLEIRDDGQGFDPGARRETRSLGLVGIEERVLMLGGNLQLESEPGCGVRLIIQFPATESEMMTQGG